MLCGNHCCGHIENTSSIFPSNASDKFSTLCLFRSALSVCRSIIIYLFCCCFHCCTMDAQLYQKISVCECVDQWGCIYNFKDTILILWYQCLYYSLWCRSREEKKSNERIGFRPVNVDIVWCIASIVSFNVSVFAALVLVDGNWHISIISV